MNTARVFRVGVVVALSVIALVLSSCVNPGTTNTSTQHTVTGVVTDTVTGLGISGATVVLGKYTAKTDSAGKYTISLDTGSTSVTGNFAVSAGTAYGFALVQNTSLDASSPSTTLNFRLIPSSMPAGVTISGKVTDSNGNDLSNVGTVNLEIVNQNGGASMSGSVNYSGTGTGYALTSYTTGSSCLVIATVTYTDTTPPSVFYLTNVNLSGVSPITLNLPVPTIATPVTVTTSYTTDNQVQLAFVVPGYGMVPAASFTPTSSPMTISISDPAGYELQWVQTMSVIGSTAGSVQTVVAAPQALKTAVNLSDFTLSPPSSYDDAKTQGSYTNGTLTFSASTDPSVTAHFVLLGPQLGLTKDTTGQPAGLTGVLWLTGSSVTLPSSIQSVIKGGTDWDIASLAGTTAPLLSTNDVLALTTAFVGGHSGTTTIDNVPSLQFAFGLGPDSIVTQFIP